MIVPLQLAVAAALAMWTLHTAAQTMSRERERERSEETRNTVVTPSPFDQSTGTLVRTL